MVEELYAERGSTVDQPTSTPQLPFKEPQVPSNRAPNRGTLGGLSSYSAAD